MIKMRLYYSCLEEVHFKCKEKHGLQCKKWTRCASFNLENVGVDVLISDKSDYKAWNLSRAREDHFTMRKRSFH